MWQYYVQQYSNTNSSYSAFSSIGSNRKNIFIPYPHLAQS